MTNYRVAIEHVVPWGKMVRTKLIKDENIKFEEVMRANDVLFSTKVACLSKRIAIAATLLSTLTTREGSLAFSQNSDAANLISRLKVFIGRNRYLASIGHKQYSLIPHYFAARKINKETAKEVLRILYKNDMLLAGFSQYMLENFAKIKQK